MPSNSAGTALGTQHSGTWTSRNSRQLGIYSRNKHFLEALFTAGQLMAPPHFGLGSEMPVRPGGVTYNMHIHKGIELPVCNVCV